MYGFHGCVNAHFRLRARTAASRRSLTGHHDHRTAILAAQLHPDDALDLAQNQIVRDATACLVVVHHLRLLADFLRTRTHIWFPVTAPNALQFCWLCCAYRGQILLAQTLGVAALLDDLAHVQRHLVVLQLIGLAVQLGRVLGGDVLFVGASTDCQNDENKYK